jgi:hypothetical protein
MHLHMNGQHLRVMQRIGLPRCRVGGVVKHISVVQKGEDPASQQCFDADPMRSDVDRLPGPAPWAVAECPCSVLQRG